MGKFSLKYHAHKVSRIPSKKNDKTDTVKLLKKGCFMKLNWLSIRIPQRN